MVTLVASVPENPEDPFAPLMKTPRFAVAGPAPPAGIPDQTVGGAPVLVDICTYPPAPPHAPDTGQLYKAIALGLEKLVVTAAVTANGRLGFPSTAVMA